MREQSVWAKVAMMRGCMGDVRTVGGRTRPGMTKLMTELRTMVSMRDRRNAGALMEIADIERDMQRIDRFRSLIIGRSEEHTSELQSLMRISYAVFCLKKKRTTEAHIYNTTLLNKHINTYRSKSRMKEIKPN